MIGTAPSIQSLPRTLSRRGSRSTVVILALVALSISMLLPIGGGLLRHKGDTGSSPVPSYFGKLPLSFVPNQGQTAEQVRFQARTPGGSLFFTQGEMVLSLPNTEPVVQETGSLLDAEHTGRDLLSQPEAEAMAPSVVRMGWIGANAAVEVVGGEQLPGKVNYLLGNDPSRWHSNVSTYGAITYTSLYPGIDLHYTGQGSALKGTYTVAAGADPSLIRWRYSGTGKVNVNGNGNLLINVPGVGCAPERVLTEQAPVAWQLVDGKRVGVGAVYALVQDGSIGFGLGEYDRSLPLIIDPALEWSTYLGGSAEEVIGGIAVDSEGYVYVQGYTFSADFPLQDPYQPDYRGHDAFITKLTPDGSALVYSTYLGGSNYDRNSGLAVDPAGNVTAAGWTGSTDFPLRHPLPILPPLGPSHGYITRLNAQGSDLIYSTYLGGSEFEEIWDVALDSSGDAIVSGSTRSRNDFPLQNPFQPAFGGGDWDAFMSKLHFGPTTNQLSLVVSTYLGGERVDHGREVEVDAQDNIYVSGYTSSQGFPVQNPYQQAIAGGVDAFLTRFTPTGDALVYSTYLGGTLNDFGDGMAVDAAGNVFISGNTYSFDFPTHNPYQATNAGSVDTFVTKLNASGSALIYSTYLGGANEDGSFGMSVDAAGNAHIVGNTRSLNFPLQDPYQPAYGGGTDDSFVTKLNAPGSALIYSTYLGGNGREYYSTTQGNAIALDPEGNAYVSGQTLSTNFPLEGQPFQSTNDAAGSLYITKLSATRQTPPTPVPGPISDGQAPRVDGVMAVWEEYQNDTWDVRAKNLVTGDEFAIYEGPGDQRRPVVSGQYIAWQDNRNGNWDIYIARIVGNSAVTAPTPVALGNGDQVNPDLSNDLVVWQSGALALATTTPQSYNRYDIIGAVVTDTIGSPIPLTAPGPNTNTNPAVAGYSGALGNITVWQSHVFTQTLAPEGGNTRWGLRGMMNFEQTPEPFVVPTRTGGDQMDPDVADRRIVWQELYTETPGKQGPQGGNTRWGMYGIENPIAPQPFTVADNLQAPPAPRMSGSYVAWQDLDPTTQTWRVQQSDLINNTTQQVTGGLDTPPQPDVSGQRLVWQQRQNAVGQKSAGGDLDVYGNVSSPTGTPPTATPAGTPPTATRTATATPLPCTGWDLVAVPAADSRDSRLVSTVARSHNDVWAVGYYVDRTTNTRRGLTQRWDGTQWSIVSSPQTSIGENFQRIIATGPTELWLAGDYCTTPNCTDYQPFFARWNGMAWQQYLETSPRSNATVNALSAVGPDDIWAVGTYQGLNGNEFLTMHWDGAAWSTELRTPYVNGYNKSLYGVAAITSNDVWAVGGYTTPTTTPLSIMLHWDGSGWAVVPIPNPTGAIGSRLYGITAGGPNDVWAVGEKYLDPSFRSRLYIIHWNGSAWTEVYGPSPGAHTNAPVGQGITYIAPDDVWITGTYRDNDPMLRNLVLHWDGSAWTHVPVPNSGAVSNNLAGMAVVGPNDLWAVGTAQGTDGTYFPQALHYTGPCSVVIPSPTVPPITPSASPAISITPSASSTFAATPSSTAVTGFFTDVDEYNPFYAYIRCLWSRGIISGYADNTFRPSNNMTRGQAAKVVANAVGLSQPVTGQTFRDVPPSHTFYMYIEGLAQAGFISGYSDQAQCGTAAPCYRPELTVTRGQLTKVVSNAAGFDDTPPSGTQTFSDVFSTHTFWVYVERLSRRGIISGYECGQALAGECDPQRRPWYLPANNLTRGQSTKIVANTFFPVNCAPGRATIKP